MNVVSENTKRVLFELIGQCFVENRFFDRLVSVLGVEFAMNNTAELIHKKMAHLFPKISDEIGKKCLERYNISVEYNSTPEGKENYNSIGEMIQVIENHCVSFQSMLIGAVKMSQDNGDLHIYSDLLDILEDFNEIVEQAILMNDKVRLYGGNFASYDVHIASHFNILGE